MQGNHVRFFSKIVKKIMVEQLGECWLFAGCIKKTGYGQFRDGAKLSPAHRHSWEIHYGKIPVGMNVLHECDVRNCVNPKHLFTGTQFENCIDKTLKGRSRRKLTREQILEIHLATESHRKLGKKYGVDPSLIGKIRRGERWPLLPAEDLKGISKVRRNSSIAV